MILAFCVDDQGGLAFNHRRQSRDRGLVADLLAAAGATAKPQMAVPAPPAAAKAAPNPQKSTPPNQRPQSQRPRAVGKYRRFDGIWRDKAEDHIQ